MNKHLKNKQARSTFSILFYINRNKVKTDGTTVIMCRLSIDGKQKTLTTGIYCLPDNWDARKGILKVERDNNHLQDFRQAIEKKYNTILQEQGVISAELLKNAIVAQSQTPLLLLEAGEQELERLQARSLKIESTSTYRQSRLSQRNLREFLLSQKTKDIAFKNITEEFGKEYKLYLKTKDYRSGHINHCLTWLNRLFYTAVDREIIHYNPLANIPYEKKEPPKLRHITRNQLQAIMARPMPDKLQELTRRTFIFSAFTALAYVDVKRLYPHHLGKTADGKQYIRIRRKKTDVETFIPLHPVAEQILSLYNLTDETKPIFPLPNRDQIWHCINEIGFLAGVKGNLSYHFIRYSDFHFSLNTSKLPIRFS